jgi:5'-deoxynucleotidase YfbR-like HD superfamily hydrolase
LTWIQTYTGRRFDLVKPRADQVCIEDIAHHLANTNRFNGATREAYSVAQHSCHVADLLPPALKRVGLLHDAAEAYVGDWTRPLKIALRSIGGHEAEVWSDADELYLSIARVVGEHFGVDVATMPEAVKHADNVMLATERRDLMAASSEPWAWLPEPCFWHVVPWSAAAAEHEFSRRFAEASVPAPVLEMLRRAE